MMPDSWVELWKESVEIDKLIDQYEDEYYADRYGNTDGMDPEERRRFELEQRISKLRREADDLVRQCESLGYLAVENPETHPEISLAHLTEPSTISKASELLSIAKSKYAAAAILEDKLYGGPDVPELYFDHAMYEWLASSCVCSCCKVDFDSAKQHYRNHLCADPIGIGLIIGGPNLKMYYTLKYLGFSDMCVEILRSNIQYLEECIRNEEKDKDDQERGSMFSNNAVWEAVCRILEYADILGDDDIKQKYTNKKRRLESTGFELEQ
jgi:hypothetical protein